MTEKPTFPKPRIIRENFLPEPMKNYRIKKETYGDTTKYYPQEKFLFWWLNIFASEFKVFNHSTICFDGGYYTLEEARKLLCEYCREPVVEYLDFDPGRDCR